MVIFSHPRKPQQQKWRWAIYIYIYPKIQTGDFFALLKRTVRTQLPNYPATIPHPTQSSQGVLFFWTHWWHCWCRTVRPTITIPWFNQFFIEDLEIWPISASKNMKDIYTNRSSNMKGKGKIITFWDWTEFLCIIQATRAYTLKATFTMTQLIP